MTFTMMIVDGYTLIKCWKNFKIKFGYIKFLLYISTVIEKQPLKL